MREWGPFVAAALPILLVLLDSALVVAVVVQGGNCVSECFAGASLFLFAPTARPLTAIGYGSVDGDPSMVLVLAILVLELILTAAWWLLLGEAITRRAALRRPEWIRWTLLYVVALVAPVYVKVAIHELDGATGPWLSVPLEALTLAIVGWSLWRSGWRRRPSEADDLHDI